MSEQNKSGPNDTANAPPAFALYFRDAGVSLMRREVGVAKMRRGGGFSLSERPGGAWSEVACCAWLPAQNGSSPDVMLPERLLAGLSGGKARVDIWLPGGLVLSRSIDDDSAAGSNEPAQRVAERAIPGLTILRSDALTIAAARFKGKVALRAVERSVLVEVCSHARRWGFDVANVRSKPGDKEFPDGAVFDTPPSAPERRRTRAADAKGGKSTYRRKAFPVIGGAAALAAVALFFLYSPTEPGDPQSPVVSSEAPVTTKTPGALRPRTETLIAGDMPSPEHASADPAPKFRSLAAEVAYSAPADQFTPVTPPPVLPAVPILKKFAPPASGAAPAIDLSSLDVETLGVAPTEAPSEIQVAAAIAPVDAVPTAIETPSAPTAQEIGDLGALTSLQAVAVDDGAGEPGEALTAPEDQAAPGAEPDLLDAKEPPAETPTAPPARLSGLNELEDTEYAALSLEEAPTPLAPPLSVRLKTDPAAVPRPVFRPGATPDAPPGPAGEFEAPPLTELAPERARPPKPRPEAIAALAKPPEETEEAETAAAGSPLAPVSVSPPRARPAAVAALSKRLKEDAAKVRQERAAMEKAQRALPTTAEIASTATRNTRMDSLDGFMLIGVFERVGARSALMRLPNGDVRRVENGDQIGRWTVAAIDSTSVNLRFQGNSQRLKLPGLQ